MILLREEIKFLPLTTSYFVMKKNLLLLAVLALPVLPACSQSAPTAALSFDFAKEFPDRGLFTWKPGMRFLKPSGDNSGFDCPLLPCKGPVFKGTDLYYQDPSGSSFDEKTLAGQTLTFQRIDGFRDRGYDNMRTDGYDKVAVVFRAANGRQYAHIISTPLAQLKQADGPVGAPCLVSLDDVDKARKLLVGQTVFVREQYMAKGSTRDEVKYLPKFVPVKITKVSPGQPQQPVRLTFQYVGGPSAGQTQEQDYILSGTNGSRAYGGGEMLPNYFLNCFSFQDPRATAGIANEKHWKAIQEGFVMKGMSMKEVELAMGKPKRRAESMEDGQRNNVWYYSRFQNKQWDLLFVNGQLDRYVNYDN